MAVQATATMTITNQAGKTSTKALTHIDPNANHYKIRQFAEGLNSLTNNTLNKVELVTREDISNALPTASVTPDTVAVQAFEDGESVTFTVNYDGEDRNFTWSGQKPAGTTIEQIDEHTLEITGMVSGTFGDGSVIGVMVITVEADDDYPETYAIIQFTNAESMGDFEDI